MRDPTLQGTALRYAAGDLPQAESEAFEARLATDEDAQDALAEAVRLSAAAIGQPAPAPTRSFRDRVRARLGGSRGYPLTWAALGATAVAVAAVVGIQLSPPPPAAPPAIDAPAPTPPQPPIAVAPEPRPVVLAVNVPADGPVVPPSPTTAEIWAELSTPERVEKAHDDEFRRRQRMRDSRPPTPAGIGMIDSQ